MTGHETHTYKNQLNKLLRFGIKGLTFHLCHYHWRSVQRTFLITLLHISRIVSWVLCPLRVTYDLGKNEDQIHYEVIVNNLCQTHFVFEHDTYFYILSTMRVPLPSQSTFMSIHSLYFVLQDLRWSPTPLFLYIYSLENLKIRTYHYKWSVPFSLLLVHKKQTKQNTSTPPRVVQVNICTTQTLRLII